MDAPFSWAPATPPADDDLRNQSLPLPDYVRRHVLSGMYSLSDAAPMPVVPGQQYAMENTNRANPFEQMGRVRGEIAGGGGGVDIHAQNALQLENHVSRWARGEVSAKDLQKEFKSRGWTVDLRRGRYDVEAFDPTGKAHYLMP